MLSPERSRNAKAQARHRAKRKAYIDHLEQNIQKLQLALGISDEQVNELESPYARIRELEIENEELRKENAILRTKQSTSFSQDVEDQQPLCSPEAEVGYTHRGVEQELCAPVQVIDPNGAACHSSLLRPHPLTIPASTATGHPTQYSATVPSATESSYSTHPPSSSIYQMSPHTPSSSGESSTPPFSPTAATQYHQHNPVDVGARSRHNSAVGAYHHAPLGYASSVKEEDRPQAGYSMPSHHHQHPSSYSTSHMPGYAHAPTEQHALGSWSYRDERTDYPHYHHSHGLSEA